MVIETANTLKKETYEAFSARLDLYNKIAAGLRDVYDGRVSPADEVLSRIRAQIRG